MLELKSLNQSASKLFGAKHFNYLVVIRPMEYLSYAVLLAEEDYCKATGEYIY